MTMNHEYKICNSYGSFVFENLQKLYKFRARCSHPSSYECETFKQIETVCERCGELIKRVQINENDRSLDNWNNEGGYVD